MNLYNNSITHRTNTWIREHIINPRMRKKLQHTDMTILCNNCNGGIISHDLGLRFNSPTVNLYFEHDDFFVFMEDLDYYLAQPLTFREMVTEPKVYPICTLGEGDKKIVLHFLHYPTWENALELWNRRKARIKKDDIYVVYAFFDHTDEWLLQRFERLPFKNKVAFTERSCPEYKSAYWIKGYPNGLGTLNTFQGFFGHRRMDQFDFVNWFNEK